MGFFKSLFSSPIGRIVAPIALSLLAPGLGTAISGGLGLGLSAGGVGAGLLGGGVLGAGQGLLTGGKPFQSALTGGLGGGLAGFANTGGIGSLLGSAAQEGSAGSGILGALGPVGTGLSNIGNSIGSGFSSLGSGIESALGIGGSGTTSVSGMSAGAPATGFGASPGIGSALASGGANLTSPGGIGASGAGLLSTGSAYGPEGFASNPGGYASAVGAMSPTAAAPAQGILGKLASNPASLLSAGANIYSGYAGQGAAKDMASAQLQSTNAALGQQAKQFGQTQANLAPYQATGAAASGNLGSLLSGDPAKAQAALEATPGYKFQLDQGTKAMNQGLAAKGNLFSGDALKAAQTFGQDLASTSYNNIVNQNQAATNTGQSGALGLGSLGAGNAAANTQLLTDQGNIGANKINNGNNAINQSLSNILGLKQYDIYGRPLRMSAYGATA